MNQYQLSFHPQDLNQLIPPLPSEWLVAAWLTDKVALDYLLKTALNSKARTSQINNKKLYLYPAHAYLLAGFPEISDELFDKAIQQCHGPKSEDFKDELKHAHNMTHREEDSTYHDEYWFDIFKQRRYGHSKLDVEVWRSNILQAVEKSSETALQILNQSESLALLSLVLCHSNAERELQYKIEPFLASLVTDEDLNSEPTLAYRLWFGIATRCKSWEFSNLKAADHSLQGGAVKHCKQFLEQARLQHFRSPWFHDIEARLWCSLGRYESAEICWKRAVKECDDEKDLVSLFTERLHKTQIEKRLDLWLSLQGEISSSDQFSYILNILTDAIELLNPISLASIEGTLLKLIDCRVKNPESHSLCIFWLAINDIYPDWKYIGLKAALSAIRIGDITRAQCLLNDLEDDLFDNPWLWMAKAKFAFINKRSADARNYWDKALTLCRNDPGTANILRLQISEITN